MNPPTARRWPALLAALLMLATAAGCTARAHATPLAVVDTPSSAFRGTSLPNPLPMPDVTLTDTNATPYPLTSRTAGHLTLLYIGYTHCPDVCPTTMADLGIAVSQLPAAWRDQIQVVFITTDPARDTPSRLRQWLDAFNPHFTGLTGSWNDISRVAAALGLSISPPTTAPDGSIVVQHSAEVLLFYPDGKARLVYSAATSVDDFTHDLTLIHTDPTP